MKSLIRCLLTLPLLFYAGAGFAQDYLNVRTLKITEVSKDSAYGYEPGSPIRIGRDKRVLGFYLNALKAPRNIKFHVDKVSYLRAGNDTLTRVDLTFEGQQGIVTLFFSPRRFEQPKAPVLFTFKTQADLPTVVRFPADKIIKVASCAPAVGYAPAPTGSLAPPDMLAKRLGTLPPQPDTYPVFTGGPAALQQYFTAHPLTSDLAKQAVFKTSILFLVNCDGKAGGYRLLADVEGRGDFETLVNQVLAPVNDMPQQWKPATKNGKPVDCYQIMSFTVTRGQLTNVAYQ
ncbi:hypothetical protein LJY25_14110 [Hymenobacter sp. BT175]|uniref:hypothetical protein n=1 Tax=Hymenobacter translucens TaxID=2886507 RepID=UPI001D0ECD00|nr:hypothetical protein [Hymenobacter translucens]MCC2547587.1 hypothetical protein [Hymenobacter translucens]